MTKLADMKSQFLSDVTVANINYDWDGGWCYNYISHPIMEEAEENLSDEEVLHENGAAWSDHDEFIWFTDEWLSEHSEELFHMSDVEGDKLINQVGTLTGQEAKEYAQGLIALIERFYPNYTGYTQKLNELKEFCK